MLDFAFAVVFRQERPMHPDIQKLVVLQQHDLALRALRVEMAALPKHVASLAATSAAAQAALIAIEEAIAKEETLRRRQESEVRDQQQKIAKVQKQMDAATTTIQVTAFEHEIAFTQTEISRLEDAELESMERSEAFERDRKAAAESVSESETMLERERLRTAEIIERDKAQVAELEAKRTALRPQIGETALANYDRIAKAKGTGLAEGVDQKCSACQMLVRPQKWNELRDRLNEELMMTCETCGRLLYCDPARDAPVKKGVEAAGVETAPRRAEG
jgi:predicted  nucleic acid-binding Zn-ribbon protein